MTQLACETMTSEQSIIAITNKSKLCHTVRLLQEKTGDDVDCPHHPGTCSANIRQDVAIGKHGVS